jgi:choline-glycine betaine transporter
MSACISAVVGISVLYMSRGGSLSAPQISALIARGSFSCLYLINAFSLVSHIRQHARSHGIVEASISRIEPTSGREVLGVCGRR